MMILVFIKEKHLQMYRWNFVAKRETYTINYIACSWPCTTQFLITYLASLVLTSAKTAS